MKYDNRPLTICFGKVIRNLREEAGFSQEEFAHKCELHRTYVGAVERGEKNVTLQTANKIAYALDMKLSYIIWLIEAELDDSSD